MKNILVISFGNPLDANTWSNMPFYLIQTLNSKGYNVIPLDVYNHTSIISKLLAARRRILSYILKKDLLISYDRSIFFDYYVKNKMRKICKKYNFDLCISLTYSFNPSEFTSAPCVMIGDWTTEYYINKILNRNVSSLEKNNVKRQNNYLKSAKCNVTIFKEVAKYYEDSIYNIVYLGNVINLPNIHNECYNFEKKFFSKEITFIGTQKYINGLNCLIEAVRSSDLKLNVIGISGKSTSKITYYGYLNKSNPKELKCYINCILNAKCVINTTDNFAGFTALSEALYLGTPVITAKTDSFFSVYGKSHFGYYCTNSPNELNKYIKKLYEMNIDNYKNLCKNCIDLTKKFTWDNFVKTMLKEVWEININEK